AQTAKAADPAEPGSITLHVQSARSVNTGPGFVHEGDPVTTYKWLINQEDVGNPQDAPEHCLPGLASDPNFADTCQWPSVRTTPGYAPIIAQGDQTTLSDDVELRDLPVGKYLISVTADGFKIDGAHFTVTSDSEQRVTVEMQPLPLPLQTIRLQVFNDNAPVDGTYEVDAEPGLAGFTANLTDVLGPVSTDYYGNPLCTVYLHAGGNPTRPILFNAAGKPRIDTAKSTGKCVSDATGQIVIPNLGPNRYAATVSPPVGSTGWVQTTTLEGGHDYDIWQQEGETGFDTEQTKGAELVPYVHFGFTKVMPLQAPAAGHPLPTGEIKGVAVAALPYVGGQNGQVVPETGFAGAKIGGPIKRPWIALSDLDAGDAEVYLGRGNADGSFDIKNVPDGSYSLTVWDDDQDYILWAFQVEVHGGQTVDVGNKSLVGWFTHIYGTVFVDDNENGKRDPGEQGVPSFTLTLRERDNSLMDQYTNTVITDTVGNYSINEGYPLSKWLVLEGFNTRYQATGITYQAENDPKPTTLLGGAVDINVLNVIGLGGRVDWGVKPYVGGTNGGIVGTITYDTTRNELDPADAAAEAYQPGVPDVPVHLYAPVPCETTTPAEECRDGFQVDTATGALKKGPELQEAYTSETWQPPRGCTARMYNGQPLTDQQALSQFGASANRKCIEAPMMGFQVGAEANGPDGFSQQVNGNYGFATSKLNLYPPGDPRNPAADHMLPLYANLADYSLPEQDLRPQEYIVSVEIPQNPVGGGAMYKVTREEDVNVFDGDTYLPQENYPPTVAQASDTPPGAGAGEPTPSQDPSQTGGIVSGCVGPMHTVHVTNPNFLNGGGSPYEGQDRPLCTDKLVNLRNAQAVAPTFNLFTDVPIPTHFWGLTINDLGLSLDKRSVEYGEAQGLPFVPMGIYDWTGRLVDTVQTDFNGFYEALEPSTSTYNCPLPAGPCPNMYRFVGNDPGQPGQLNPSYNPRFRTIATNFQAWPGLYTVTDTAPTQVQATALTPGTTQVDRTMCDLDPAQPQPLAVDRPYIRRGDLDRKITVTGFGFGAQRGQVLLNGQPTGIVSWTDKQVVFTVPNAKPFGPTSVEVVARNGKRSVNGLTVQVLSAQTPAAAMGRTPQNPQIAEVGPTSQYRTIQAALEAATPTSTKPYWLVVVWPGEATAANPHGEYTENVIFHHQVRMQGVGPGGFDPDGSFVPGSIIDGAGFNPDNPSGADWIALLSTLRYSGPRAVPDAATVTVLNDPQLAGVVPSDYYPAIDGFTITGGSQSNFPANINEVNGGIRTPYGADGALVTQGGGVFVHAGVMNLRITDNVIRGNSGSYAGGIRVGTPYAGNLRNYSLYVGHNQIRDNGGTNLAGGIGLFNGSDGYQIDHNAICGNFSAEYGGALTAYGYQVHPAQDTQLGVRPGGRITDNTIWFNQSYDEGGAVMIAGELPSDPTVLSEGSGPVLIDSNVISTNLANDDGGGIRLLQTSGSHITRANPQTITISNNTVTDNVSAHEGGGMAFDDAAFVDVVNNTVARNLTTATAITSDGQPAPAGLSTAANSDPLTARLARFGGSNILWSTPFSKPTLLNNVFWDNRAGSYSGGYVYGIGGQLPDGSANDVNNWDMGVADVDGALLTPVNSVLQTTQGVDVGTTNVLSNDPGFKDPYEVTVNILAARGYPAFRQAAIVAELLPPHLQGDYHLTGPTSPAYGLGTDFTTVAWDSRPNGWHYAVTAPSRDIDGDVRPSPAPALRYDAGSDQLP
ncbi:MAG TPA: IPT/TIG domain-containing protein, partial [Angustibacter sp.]|nr:IPT/TIG domain-containing protein [Angustibacter sp.]